MTAVSDTARMFRFDTETFGRFVAADEHREFPSVAYVPGSTGERFSATHWLQWIVKNSHAIRAADTHLRVSIRIGQGIYTVCVSDSRQAECDFTESDVQDYVCPWEVDPEQPAAFAATGESVARENLANICAVANKMYHQHQSAGSSSSGMVGSTSVERDRL